MSLAIQIAFVMMTSSRVSSSISGISYMDPHIQRPLKTLPGEDPCNPLYWYPRQIPEYCYRNPIPAAPMRVAPAIIPPPLPLPLPAPMAMPHIPIPVPVPVPYPMPQPMAPQQSMPMYPPHIPQFIPPGPYPPMPTQYIIPNTNTMSGPQAGLVPGIQGLVSQDGGINILPFSDAYSDLLEKHKQKILRKKLQRVLDEYEDFPRRRRRKYSGTHY